MCWAILLFLLLKRDVLIDPIDLKELKTVKQAESEEFQAIYFREQKIGYVGTTYRAGPNNVQLLEQEARMCLNIARTAQTITLQLKATLSAGNQLLNFEASAFALLLTVTIVYLFPAKRTKDIALYLSLCFGLFLYLIFRLMRPEDLVNPDRFGQFVEYFSAISAPTGLANALLPDLGRHPVQAPAFSIILFTTPWQNRQGLKRTGLRRAGAKNPEP